QENHPTPEPRTMLPISPTVSGRLLDISVCGNAKALRRRLMRVAEQSGYQTLLRTAPLRAVSPPTQPRAATRHAERERRQERGSKVPVGWQGKAAQAAAACPVGADPASALIAAAGQ